MFSCEKCQQVFSLKCNLNRHMRNKHCVGLQLICSICQKKFRRQDAFVQHQRSIHGIEPQRKDPLPNLIQNSTHRDFDESAASTSASKSKIKLTNKLCDVCGKFFSSHATLAAHLRSEHITSIEKDVEQVSTCYKNRVACYKIGGVEADDDIPSYLTRSRETVRRLINNYISDIRGLVKAQIELLAVFIKSSFNENGEEGVIASMKNFNTKFKVITSITFEEIYDKMIRDIIKQSEDFQEQGSGWAFFSVSHLLLNVNKFQPIPGSSYIRLPSEIINKKACINIKNNDNACFAWCLTAALHPAQISKVRTSSYPHYSQVLNLEGITFPVHLKDISKIETLNNLSINVYELVFDSINYTYNVEGPIHFTKNRRDTHVNLLYLFNNGIGHFVLIKNLSRLISKHIANHNGAIRLCDGCLTRFSSADKLSRHQQYDCNHITTILPSKNLKSIPNFMGNLMPENILEFNNYKNTQMVPFVIYADFESILKPIEHCEPDFSKSFTEKVDIHQPYSFAYYIVSTVDGTCCKFETYTGLDCPKVFILKLMEDVRYIYHKYIKYVKPMTPLTVEEQVAFEATYICHICKTPFGEDVVKVHDHCHITGKYRGPAHVVCNLNFKIPKFIPVFLHNFSCYDAHLFVKEMADIEDVNGIDVLPNNKEKYISFSKSVLVDQIQNQSRFENRFMKLRFLDSFRFMASSLDSLSSNLVEEDFVHVRKFFPCNKQFQLLKRKGIFPYGYIDSLEKLSETSLPQISGFFNKLSFENITDKDYLHAQTVWQTFQCQNLKDYSDLYLKTDVLLLADVFEKFRRVCFETYGLDPAHYYTTPGLTWDAMLKFTKIKLELLTDVDQVHFIKKGIRGGISQCSLRHAKANNKYMDNYDSNSPSKFLMYWDANNLYGWAMSQPMPYGDFKWLDDTEIQNLNLNHVSDEADYGYILDVDIEYPHYLHDIHNDLPFLAENICPPNSSNSESEKRLIPNLFNKKNYIVHYRNLKHAIAHGLKVLKVNRVLSFKQSAWLKPYIDMNTKLRQSAKNDFERDFFKLMNNSVFGKTMENVDKRVDVRLITSWDDICGKGRSKPGARSLIAKLNFKNIKIFTETFSAIQMERLRVVYNKPIYVGFTVLEISKLLMYEFYYNFLKPKYNEAIRLCYMDTDSFTVHINTDDLYEDIKLNLDKFDTSNYHLDNQFKIPLKNKAVLGLMKDENCGRIMTDFIGLRSKMYANRVIDGRVTKKAKGVKKAVVKHKIKFENYFDCLTLKNTMFAKQILFRSCNHTVYTVLQNKLVLSPYDAKRFIKDDGIDTLAWGHNRIVSSSSSEGTLQTLKP
ncbi:uncharacterized protein [Onthophagus taurus]|uniref:uncharacterized protein n=1 Tax=Onthophagus taurus TaxID=166361 RepID=UPI0039BE9701